MRSPPSPRTESTPPLAAEPAASAATAPAIRCRGLRKVYGGKVEAVRHLDLEVARGECFGLLGPNGAGKTTTIEILEGLLEPTAGEVEVLGESWGRTDEELRQRIGISLQETRLSDKLKVLETVRLFRSFYREGIDPAHAMALVSLTPKADAQVGKLSGGQRQRLAVACALVGKPDLLFLDEPTSGLDPQSRRQLWEVIREVQARGCTILITTHYMDEAEQLCDRVGIVDQGEIIALGHPAALIRSVGGDHVLQCAVRRSAAGPPSPEAAADPCDAAGADEGDPDAADSLLPRLQALECVREARRDGSGLRLTVAQVHVAVPALLHALRESELDIVRLSTRHATLEDVFVNLTGRRLRDEEAVEGP